MSGVLRVASRI